MFDPDDYEMPLGALVVMTAKMLAESMLEQDPRSAPPISLLLCAVHPEHREVVRAAAPGPFFDAWT